MCVGIFRALQLLRLLSALFDRCICINTTLTEHQTNVKEKLQRHSHNSETRSPDRRPQNTPPNAPPNTPPKLHQILHQTLHPAITKRPPELVAAVDGLLFEAEDDRAQILVLGEVVPVLRAVEVLLERLLLDGGELERAVLVEVLLDRRLVAVRRPDGGHTEQPVGGGGRVVVPLLRRRLSQSGTGRGGTAQTERGSQVSQTRHRSGQPEAASSGPLITSTWDPMAQRLILVPHHCGHGIQANPQAA